MTPGVARTVTGALLVGACTLTGCGGNPFTGTTITEPHQPSLVEHAATVSASVVKVVDGDTVDVRDDQRGLLRIRIVGIDAPESVKPGFTVGCFGPEASAHAHTELDGRRIALVIDPTQDATDRYGRTLVYVVRDDGYDYGTETVRAGFAKSYVYDRIPGLHAAAIADAQRQAQQRSAGLWGPPCNGHTDSAPK